MKKLIYFYFERQQYRNFLGVFASHDVTPEFYGMETQVVGRSKSALGCRNMARAVAWKYKELENNPDKRLETILASEIVRKEIEKKQRNEWKEHATQFQSIKYIKP